MRRELMVSTAALMLATTPAAALTKDETSFVQTATTLLFITLACDNKYLPNPEVLIFFGRKVLGSKRTQHLMKAIGAALPYPNRKNPPTPDPEVTPIVREMMSKLLEKSDHDRNCQVLGDAAVKDGLADRAK